MCVYPPRFLVRLQNLLQGFLPSLFSFLFFVVLNFCSRQRPNHVPFTIEFRLSGTSTLCWFYASVLLPFRSAPSIFCVAVCARLHCISVHKQFFDESCYSASEASRSERMQNYYFVPKSKLAPNSTSDFGFLLSLSLLVLRSRQRCLSMRENFFFYIFTRWCRGQRARDVHGKAQFIQSSRIGELVNFSSSSFIERHIWRKLSNILDKRTPPRPDFSTEMRSTFVGISLQSAGLWNRKYRDFCTSWQLSCAGERPAHNTTRACRMSRQTTGSWVAVRLSTSGPVCRLSDYFRPKITIITLQIFLPIHHQLTVSVLEPSPSRRKEWIVLHLITFSPAGL